MKVGDLVKWVSILNDDVDRRREAYGVVVKISRTGHATHSAEVLFTDGSTDWFDTQRLEVINEGR